MWMTLVVVAFLMCVEGFEEENNCYNIIITTRRMKKNNEEGHRWSCCCECLLTMLSSVKL